MKPILPLTLLCLATLAGAETPPVVAPATQAPAATPAVATPVVEAPAETAPAAPESAEAAAPVTVQVPLVDVPAAQESTAYPAFRFVSSIATNELFDIIHGHPAFAKLDKELVGSPITLRVVHTLQPTAGGKAAGLFSAVLAGGTLGLLPVVTSNTLVINYEVLVHGEPVASFDYRRGLTQAVNIWTAASDPTYGLGADGLEWLKSTAKEFAEAAAVSPELAELRREYEFYFGPVTPAGMASAGAG